jgi:hypothetical protein
MKSIGNRVQFPKGMDANEYALKVAPAAKSLGPLIRKAVWLGKGEAGSLLIGISPRAPGSYLVGQDFRVTIAAK